MVSDEVDIDEVDLESPQGRSLLLQEIEDLALSGEAATDPHLFANSEVFELVAKLQTALTDIDQTVAIGYEITQAQVDRVQDLYDQLAVEVELPANISIYVGPSRKDIVLEDMGEWESVSITRPTPDPVTPRSIHNSLPIRPSQADAPNQSAQGDVSDSTSVPTSASQLSEEPGVEPATLAQPTASVERKSLYTTDTPEAARKRMINAIEAAELSLLDSWINDYQSPYVVLGDMPFADLQKMAAAPVNSRQYVEFKSLLALQNVKYEVFNQWSQQFTQMRELVDQVDDKTFKEVIDQYIVIISAT